MIIRLMGIGQYELDEEYIDDLNRIDNTLVEIVENEDHERFEKTYPELIKYVQKHGRPLPDEEIRESDIIIPPDDLTLEEAKKIFTGEGILED
ncbi:hypothetical protein FHEFKHOI_01196 [Candidatus Methanoperedenaceae archaeon GB50]|nr:MAG: hypothetical protein KBONHNOK_00385 [Candidatus Methanoperedenaceae archaeon GB50]CAD7772170.1 hypothetical protein AIOGIFDO_01188 [Candidatus Methanoperedenaceae archaeon GB37]CAD7772283.1 hypothetical protein FHEFKHOI_01196 [Candidatus Methanoperedenaceae archaeon GB50]